jgi:hypothetical protein
MHKSTNPFPNAMTTTGVTTAPTRLANSDAPRRTRGAWASAGDGHGEAERYAIAATSVGRSTGG